MVAISRCVCFVDREHYIEEFVGHLRAEMKAEGVKAEVYGRPKHIYSIWRKMQKKNLAFDELFDVRAAVFGNKFTHGVTRGMFQGKSRPL